jgi:uncharacterized protein with HEPN domain
MKSSIARDKERFRHIMEALGKIELYTANLSVEEFIFDSKCNEAVLFQLSVIGEAIAHVSKTILDKYPYPWHTVRAQRNVIAHEYFGIRLDMIWNVVHNDLPELKTIIIKILSEEF